MSKTRWDVYVWVGSGDTKVIESNVSLKDAQKARDKWIAKSPKHEAFIAQHEHKKFLKGVLDANNDVKPEPKKSKSKSKKDKAKKSKDKKDKAKKQHSRHRTS